MSGFARVSWYGELIGFNATLPMQKFIYLTLSQRKLANFLLCKRDEECNIMLFMPVLCHV